MGRYLSVTISTEGLYQVGSRSFGTVGIVGHGVGSGFTVDTAYTIRSPAEAATLFGSTSALYQSILLLFSNGATEVIAVPATAAAQSAETFNGDGSTTEFTLTQNPVQPVDQVEIVGGADAGIKVEGTDFYVDYGNKKVIFYVAPLSGTDNVDIDYSIHQSAAITSALAVLTNEDVALALLAMTFDSTLLALLKSHCDAMKGVSNRIGFFMLKNGETTTTLATTLASECSVLVAHKSLKDVAAAVAGKVASLRPHKDLTMKNIKSISQSDQFTSSEITAFDTAYIITMYDPPKLTGAGNVVSTGWTLDSTGTLQFIDQVRTAHHIASVLELGLTNPNVIGEMRMNRDGLQQLDSFVRGLLNPLVKSKMIDKYTIDSPALRLFRIANPTGADITEMQNLQSSRRLEDPYHLTVECVYSGTIIYIAVTAALTGGA